MAARTMLAKLPHYSQAKGLSSALCCGVYANSHVSDARMLNAPQWRAAGLDFDDHVGATTGRNSYLTKEGVRSPCK